VTTGNELVHPAHSSAERSRISRASGRTARRAFQIDLPFVVAGLVLVLTNVANILPLWPGNVGLLQAAIALPLLSYGIGYAHGFAFGIGLQAIEASVGVSYGIGFFLHEGL
jgi:hypothetical protein